MKAATMEERHRAVLGPPAGNARCVEPSTTNRRRFAAITAIALLICLAWSGDAAAFDCWGKVNPDACSLHGSCMAKNFCVCDLGYEGQECDKATFCKSPTACPTNCNYPKGLCTTLGLQGECFCSERYYGSCCQLVRTGTLKPAALDFGAVNVGATKVAQTAVTFANPLQTYGMTIGLITLSGANTADFALGGTCAVGGVVAAGTTCTVTVSFTPGATGSRGATLTVNELTTTLTGTGTIATTDIVVDPGMPSTLYAAMDGAGVYKSIDRGGTWTGAATQPTNTRVKALVILPGNSAKLYAATYGGGVYSSADSGANWSACANTGLSNMNLVSLAVDAAGKLYAGSEAGVFISTDNCATWTAINTGLP